MALLGKGAKRSHVLDELVDELGPARQGGAGRVNEV